MRRSAIALVSVITLTLVLAPPLDAATPSSGTLSRAVPTVGWTGSILTSNPLDVCLPADPACDRFFLTIEQLPKDSLVTITITGASENDDLDLFVIDPQGKQLSRSATGSHREEVTLYQPAPGLYEIQTLSFLSVPGAKYSGVAELVRDRADRLLRGAFRATAVDRARYEAGRPSNPASSESGSPLRIRATYLGREAFEPSIGINPRGNAFMTTASFDVAGNLASTEVHRSRDANRSWQSIQPTLVMNTTEPPVTLDPYVYVDPDTGRVFNVELYVGCSWLNFSDDEGATWTRNVLACGVPVDDHQTVVAAKPRAGLPTVAYPNVVVYCVNQVADSPCGRSLDGGLTFLPAGVAFTGFDAAAGGFCGGLHGHLASDLEGRLFLPKGHCGFPWVAVSEDSGTTWQRSRVNDFIRQPHHEASAATDSAGNVYVTWWDSRDRLPYLSISRDHGRTWSTPLLVAPPGVFEVNFPTITAGDAGRIAIHFPGSTSLERTRTRPWNTYLMVSTNALDPEPTFVWTTANDPADPVRRGDCGPGRCGGMFDFLDIQTSPANGAFWAAAVDTCTNACITADGPSDAADGFAILQLSGPSLWDPARRPKK